MMILKHFGSTIVHKVYSDAYDLSFLVLNKLCILQTGEAALNWACYNEKSEMVSLLLKAGARTDIQEEVAIAQSALI